MAYIKKTLLFFIIFIALGISFCFYYYKSIETKVITAFGTLEWYTPSKVFSKTKVLRLNDSLSSTELKALLIEENYIEVNYSPQKPGQFQLLLEDDVFRFFIFKNKLVYLDLIHPPQTYLVEISNNKIINIQDENFIKYPKLIFNPIKITEFYGPSKQERKLLKLEDFPPHVLYAVICSEDKRFLTHKGLDPRGIIRAIINDLSHGRLKEGGSTITQQLVKNLYLSNKKSLIRKFNEAIMSIIIENNYSKDKILEAYLNEIYLGQRGSVEIRGMGQASEFYFNKDIKDISIAEAALLTAIIPSPGGFSPYKENSKAYDIQKRVLLQMLTEKTITSNEYNQAVNEKIYLAKNQHSRVLNIAPFFVDHLKFELNQAAIFFDFKTKDFRIYSTIKLHLQKAARAAISSHIKRLSSDYPWLSDNRGGSSSDDLGEQGNQMGIEAALLALNPHTGEIYASVGGKNYSTSNYNRVIFGLRQPGSVLKPFVFLAAFNDKRGIQTITPRTYVNNSPLTIQYDSKTWSPKNYNDSWSEPLGIFEILYNSINVPTVRIAKSIGFEKVSETISKLKFNIPDYVVPSISLGSIEASLLDVARAYGVLANGGFLVEPTTIVGISDNNDTLIYKKTVEKKPVFSEESTYMITEMLKYVIDRGTGKLAYNSGLKTGFYGKTGTTSNYHDAWFAGYTKDIVVVVWVGFDYQKNLKLTGSVAALPIWVEFMKSFYNNDMPEEISPPENIVFEEIEIDKKKELVPFIKGTSHLNPPIIN